MSKKNGETSAGANYAPINDRIRHNVEDFSRQRRHEDEREAARMEKIKEAAFAQMRKDEERAQQQARYAALAAQQAPYGVSYDPRMAQRQPQSGYDPRVARAPRRQQEMSYTTPDKKLGQRKSRRTMHLGGKAIAGIIVAGVTVGGGVAYAANHDDVNGFIASMTNQTQAHDRTVKIGDANNNLDAAAFAPDSCMEPQAVLMVANFKDIEYPLVPIITTSTQSTAGPSGKIFIDQTPNGLSTDYQTAYTNDAKASVDGYAAATIENLPMAIMACEDGDGAISQSANAATIDMSKFKIIFGDPSQVFHDTSLVNALYSKGGGTEDIKLDPNKGEYLKYPDPAYWLMKSSDKTQVDSATAISNAMFTPTQMQALLATAEASAYSQLVDPTYKGEGISYPDGANDLRQAVMNAIAKRLKLDASKINFSGSNFKYSLELPIDPATKQAITTVDPSTGKSALVGLDPTQKAHIVGIDVVNGTLTPPKVAPSPPATPTPTTSTTPAPTKP